MNASEHAAAIKAAIEAARQEGYLFQTEADDYYGDMISTWLVLVRNKRGADGVMRNEERAFIEEVHI